MNKFVINDVNEVRDNTNIAAEIFDDQRKKYLHNKSKNSFDSKFSNTNANNENLLKKTKLKNNDLHSINSNIPNNEKGTNIIYNIKDNISNNVIDNLKDDQTKLKNVRHNILEDNLFYFCLS